MAEPLQVTVRIADYAQVKAVFDAADEVVEAHGSAPWILSEKIEALESRLAELTPANNGHEDDGN